MTTNGTLMMREPYLLSVKVFMVDVFSLHKKMACLMEKMLLVMSTQCLDGLKFGLNESKP